MRRIALLAALLLAAFAAWITGMAGADDSHTYHVEMYNAFGLVKGSDVRIAGVNAGSVTGLAITPDKRALLTIETSGPLAVLGKDTRCSSEPQSLIAEYFLTCSPRGPALPDGGTIPASHVHQTVQTDLVQDTLREPFKDRLALLINEFGTALAGNPQDLNQAIRLGAPALEQLKKALDILASENRTIRDLNANSDTIISQLTARRQDVIKFIQEARDTAAISAQRRADLSADFNRLDDFLNQLHPTLTKLGDVAQQTTPLLSDLHAAAPDLNTVAVKLPPFDRATQRSLETLGQAAVPGREALRQGKDEIQTLAASGRHAFTAADTIDKFLLDIDTPKRKVEIDKRAADTCPPGTAHANTLPCYSTGRKAPTGYTGMEGLLNYVYYQTGAINQFDQVGHLLHFSLFDVGVGPCNNYNAGHTGADFGVPAKGGGTTTQLSKAADCVSWLGPNQPGINQEPGIHQISRYDGPSVCPFGSTDTRLCDPSVSAHATAKTGSHAHGAKTAATGTAGRHARAGTTGPSGPAGTGNSGQVAPGLPPSPLQGNPNDLPQRLQDLLGLGGNGNGGGHGGGLLGGGHGGGLLGHGGNGGGLLGGGGNNSNHGGGLLGGGGLLKQGGGAGSGQAANDLLDFLFSP